MNKLTREKRDRIILTGVAAAVLVAGLWFGFIRSQKTKVKETAAEITRAADKVAQARRRIEKESQIQSELETATARLKDIEGQMASGDLYSWVIVTLNKFRSAYKVDIPSFTREQIGEVGILPEFPYRAATFVVRGSAYYHDLGKFLADFENRFPYIRLQNLEIEPVGTPAATAPHGPADQEKLSFKMEIVALIKPTTSS
jgi:Tfp pilus assembly protein PilO